jgi:hypothetical protein
VKHLSGAPFWGRLLASLTNNRLGWKGLPGTNAPAYYENSKITATEGFIGLTPDGEDGEMSDGSDEGNAHPGSSE